MDPIDPRTFVSGASKHQIVSFALGEGLMICSLLGLYSKLTPILTIVYADIGSVQNEYITASSTLGCWLELFSNPPQPCLPVWLELHVVDLHPHSCLWDEKYTSMRCSNPITPRLLPGWKGHTVCFHVRTPPRYKTRYCRPVRRYPLATVLLWCSHNLWPNRNHLLPLRPWYDAPRLLYYWSCKSSSP